MSNKITQKDAVYNAVVSVLNNAGVQVAEGTNYASVLTREHRASITNILFQGFKNDSIQLDKTFSDDKELRTYCSGLISNWVRKDPRLNGGTKHEAKNPGSRVGSTDPQLKALRQLLKVQTEPERVAEIQQYIDQRIEALNLNKKKQIDIDYNALPDELKAKFSPASFDEESSDEESADEDE